MKYSFGLDLVRAIAILSVIAGHFFLNTGFANAKIDDISLFLQGAVFYFFTTIGVPLFLILTGYLNISKESDFKYYRRITRIIISYFVISLVTVSVQIGIGAYPFSLPGIIKGILSFRVIGYAWYIEMYLGLFLLIPWLNILFHQVIKSPRKIAFLMGSLFFLSACPIFTNRYGLYLLPQYWTVLWIVLYYYIGGLFKIFYSQGVPRWFGNYRKWWLLGSGILCFVNSVVTVIFKGNDYIAIIGGSSAPAGIVLSSIVFLALYQTKSFMIGNSIVASLAKHSLDMYLFSYLGDQLLYPIAKKYLYLNQSQFFVYYIPMVVGVIVFSWVASILKLQLFRFCSIITSWIYENRHCSQ